MMVEIIDRGAATVVAPAGEVDLEHSPRLRRVLTELMLDHRTVVVDLGGVSYLDSSGIASLVEAYQLARGGAGRLTLANLSPPALRVLRLARLDQVFAIADTVDAALGSGS